MFFRKLFSKDSDWYVEKGNGYLSGGQFADARHAFEEALDRLPAGAAGEEQRVVLRAKLAEAGNGLAELNIAEARLYLNQNNPDKAREYLEFALQLAEDGAVREKAETLMNELTSPRTDHVAKKEHSHHGCASCHSPSHQDLPDAMDESLSLEDKFYLITNVLPGNLSQRYASLGKDFAKGYLALHEGDLDSAYRVFAELAETREQDDILLYELGALTFRGGDVAEAERLFRASRAANDCNPLTRLGLAQLLIFSKRLDEALTELQSMVDDDLLANEAVVMIGDVLALKDEHAAAIDHFAKLLESKPHQKVAAERLVPLLIQQGRESEAEFLAKTYLKGCC